MKRLALSRRKVLKNIFPVLFLLFALIGAGPLWSQAAAQQETAVAAGTTDTTETTETAEPVETPPPSLTPAEIEKIEAFIRDQMRKAKIPGLAVAIVKEGRTVYSNGFGFADLKKKAPVTPATLFEMGSATKFFTGLAILDMEEKGLIKLDDPVEKYFPWLKMKYRGQEVSMTLRHLLHQSTGLQYYETLAAIPPSTADDALEKAVHTLVGKELSMAPGEGYNYTSVAYDVLGLIIQQVSGQPYEEYIKQHLFKPLQLDNTYLFREEAGEKGMATGYKICFGKPAAYDAPMYRGNTPSAYGITNVEDMARWLKIQMGTIEYTGISKEVIEKSHLPAPDLNSPNYAAGWNVFPHQNIITHGGLNPNYASSILFGGDKIGVALLANIGAMPTNGIGHGIMAILRGMEPQVAGYDRSTQYDNLSSKLFMILSILLVLNLVLLIISIIKIIKGKKRFCLCGTGRIITLIIATLLFLVLIYVITIIPQLLGVNVPLGFGLVWMPCSFGLAILWLFLTGLFLYLFVLSFVLFRKRNQGN